VYPFPDQRIFLCINSRTKHIHYHQGRRLTGRFPPRPGLLYPGDSPVRQLHLPSGVSFLQCVNPVVQVTGRNTGMRIKKKERFELMNDTLWARVVLTMIQ
jgi:hypothetical protein